MSASLCLVLASMISAFSRGVRGRTFSNQPSIAGVWPSASTRVFRACTRRQTGLSTMAWREEWMSPFGPRPQCSPLEISWNSIGPLAPSEISTAPVSLWLASGMMTPSQPFRAATTSGVCTIWWKWGEAISSSPSATSTRLTGSLRPAALKACRAARKVDSGPFWLTAPRPVTTLP